MAPALIQPMNNKPWKRQVNKGHAKKNCKGCAVENLLAEAALVEGDFEALFDHFMAKTKCDTDKYKLWGKAVESVGSDGQKVYYQTVAGRIIMEVKNRSVTQCGKLKGAPRIEQKCHTKYKKRAADKGNTPAIYINDVVRGTLTFKNCADMLDALNYMEKMENKAIPGLNFKYTVVRIKQIYEPKSALLYGDVKLNIQIKNADGIAHNCELQLNHLEMIKAKGTKDGHGAYEAWRNMDDEHWANEHSQMPGLLRDMKEAYRAKATKIVHQSHSAYYKAATALSKDNKYKTLLDKVKDWSDKIKAKVANKTLTCYDK